MLINEDDATSYCHFIYQNFLLTHKMADPKLSLFPALPDFAAMARNAASGSHPGARLSKVPLQVKNDSQPVKSAPKVDLVKPAPPPSAEEKKQELATHLNLRAKFSQARVGLHQKLSPRVSKPFGSK